MNNRDCCCLCFDARSGVMIIGALLWMSFISANISLSVQIFYAIDGATPFFFWFYIPSILINLLLGIMFCKVVSAYQKENDWGTRKKFARMYLVWGVFANALLSICAFVAGWIQFSNFCWDQPGNMHCSAVLWEYNWWFWTSFTWTIVIQAYFAHVCKLYAELADPLNRNHADPHMHQQRAPQY